MNYELRHEVKYKNIRSSLREHIFVRYLNCIQEHCRKL